jgi:hypothetical protein
MGMIFSTGASDKEIEVREQRNRIRKKYERKEKDA